MQIFFDIVGIISLFFSTFVLIVIYCDSANYKNSEIKNKENFLKYLNELKLMVDKLKEEVIYSKTKSHQQYNDLKERIDLTGAILDRLAVTKEPAPKPNNWDSMHAAFRVPTKVGVNE
jgi:hypothetical protein